MANTLREILVNNHDHIYGLDEPVCELCLEEIQALITKHQKDLLLRVRDEVIKDDEPDIASQYSEVENLGLPLQAIVFRNQLRATQRQSLNKIIESL